MRREPAIESNLAHRGLSPSNLLLRILEPPTTDVCSSDLDASSLRARSWRQAFARDCVKVAEQTIIESNLLDPDTLAEWRKDAVAQVDEAVATAQKEAVPEADKEDWCALSTRDLVDHVGEEE